MQMILCPRFQEICEKIYYEETGNITSDISEIVKVAKNKIFDFDYEIFDSAYKPVLETKIIKHYYLRRLCVADYDKWKLFIENVMNEIMPYYNQFYKAETMEINPLYNFKINVRHTDSGGDTLQSTTGTTKNISGDVTSENNKAQTIEKDLTNTGSFEKKNNSNVTNTFESENSTTNNTTSTVEDTVEGITSLSKNESSNKNITKNNNIDNKTDVSSGTTTQNETSSSKNSSESNDSVNMFNDTPQGRLSDVKSGDYLTDARVINDNKNSDETNRAKGKELVTGKTVTVNGVIETGTDNETGSVTGSENGNNSSTENASSTIENTVNGTENSSETGNTTGNESGSNTNSETGTVTNNSTTTTTSNSISEETGSIEKNEELTTNRQYVEEVLGIKDKSQSELLIKYRESFINIDMMIIKELGQIFDSRLYINDYLPHSFDNETDGGDWF